MKDDCSRSLFIKKDPHLLTNLALIEKKIEEMQTWSSVKAMGLMKSKHANHTNLLTVNGDKFICQ